MGPGVQDGGGPGRADLILKGSILQVAVTECGRLWWQHWPPKGMRMILMSTNLGLESVTVDQSQACIQTTRQSIATSYSVLSDIRSQLRAAQNRSHSCHTMFTIMGSLNDQNV